jgi:hypothetical protein
MQYICLRGEGRTHLAAIPDNPHAEEWRKSNNLKGLAGAPGEIRTPDPQIRSLVLYPAELRALRGLIDDPKRQVNPAVSHPAERTPSPRPEAARRHAGRAPGLPASSPAEIVSAGTIPRSVTYQVRPFSITMTLRFGPSDLARRWRNSLTLGLRHAPG